MDWTADTDLEVAAELAQRFPSKVLYPVPTAVESGYVADLARRSDDEIVFTGYCLPAETATLAVLSAEQRWLVEQEGGGAVAGDTYLEKARERLRRLTG